MDFCVYWTIFWCNLCEFNGMERESTSMTRNITYHGRTRSRMDGDDDEDDDGSHLFIRLYKYHMHHGNNPIYHVKREISSVLFGSV